MSNKELQLLAEALNNGSEAEADGVKYVFMDENTVYRFENNRMKKVAAGLIKKANKLIKAQQQGERVDEDGDDPPPKPKPKKKQPKPSRYLEADDDDDGEQADDEESEPDAKPIKKINKRLKKEVNTTPTVDLNEYYHTKNKLEFMTLELDRLNNKVSKLKQYKTIVNKITGGEYDQPAQYNEQQALTSPPPQAEPQQSANGKRYNDGLFMF